MTMKVVFVLALALIIACPGCAQRRRLQIRNDSDAVLLSSLKITNVTMTSGNTTTPVLQGVLLSLNRTVDELTIQNSNNENVPSQSTNITTDNVFTIQIQEDTPEESSDEETIDTPEDAIAGAREMIIDIINWDKRIGYKFVRLGFHDCVGGCDGCVDMLNPDNNGLMVPIDALADIVQTFAVHGVTRADIWALAALTAADQLKSEENVIFQFKWIGRPTCEQLNLTDPCLDSDCSPTRGPDRILPSPNFDTHEVLTYFDETFGFDARQTVVLMGAHSIGLVQRANTGFVGDGWSKTPTILNNAFYQALVGPGKSRQNQIKDAKRWKRRMIDNSDLEPSMPNRHQWSADSLFMLNSDMSLVRNFTGHINSDGKVSCSFAGRNRCPLASTTFELMAKFRNDNALWLDEFRDVFTFMLEFPFNPNIECTQEVCFLNELAT